MELTIEQRKIGMKYHIMSLLSQDIIDKRYTELQQLYEALRFKDNKKLVEKLSEERNIPLPFTEIIYNDILLVIADYIMERSEILDLFETLYIKRYPHIQRLFSDIESQYKKHGSISYKKSLNYNNRESHFFYYFVYKSEIFKEPDKIFNGFNFKKDEALLNYCFYLPDKNLIDDQLIFCSDTEEFTKHIQHSSCNEKESVLDSVYFKKYINKRRIALAEYLGIEENNLAEYIHSEMKAQIHENGLAASRYGTIGTIETFTRNIIADSNGGTFWYSQMTGTYGTNEKFRGFNYIPDVDRLIENYYKSYVTSRYLEEMKKNEGFTKLTLSRECIPQNIEADYQMILCMYEMDVLYKMFSIMQNQYYQDFSWEKITNQDMAKRYEQIIANLEKAIKDKENQIEILLQKNHVLSLQIVADSSKQTAPLVAENNKLLKVINDKDSVIEDLKRQLQYQVDFIAELNKPEAVEMDNSYDIEKLQTRRFLFVGHIAEALPELRHKFPNSLFMDNESFNLSGIEVDAVVMLIKWMSHSMFYKIKSAGNLSQVRTIMCNTKNVDTILKKMYDEMI